MAAAIAAPMDTLWTAGAADAVAMITETIIEIINTQPRQYVTFVSPRRTGIYPFL